MFVSSEILTLIGLLLMAIAISLINIGSVVPYAKANSYYRYEGFREGVADTTTTASSSSPSSGSGTESSTPISGSSTTAQTTTSNPAPSSSPSTVSTEGTYVGADDITMIIKNANSIITAINNAKTGGTQTTPSPSTSSVTPITTSTATKVEGMIGGMIISPSPAYSDSVLDTYSLNEGSIMCNASPYSNSQGYICMTDKQKQLLTTRGGNQTYRGDTYGTP